MLNGVNISHQSYGRTARVLQNTINGVDLEFSYDSICTTNPYEQNNTDIKRYNPEGASIDCVKILIA